MLSSEKREQLCALCVRILSALLPRDAYTVVNIYCLQLHTRNALSHFFANLLSSFCRFTTKFFAPASERDKHGNDDLYSSAFSANNSLLCLSTAPRCDRLIKQGRFEYQRSPSISWNFFN